MSLIGKLATLTAAIAVGVFPVGASLADAPRGAVKTARTTEPAKCTSYVDAAGTGGKGTVQNPHKTIAAAIEAAEPGAVICVAEGTYAEQLKAGEKDFTLAGGFQRGKDFKVRDSAAFVSKAKGKGGSFLRIEDPGPKGKQLIAIDGFEISGYSQAIYRDFYESQRFDVTNNFIHDNVCADQALAGAGVALVNVSGVIKGNVFLNNACGRGGAVFLNDSKNENTVAIENNRIDGNAGTEPDSSHGGAVYVFGNTLTVTGNEFTNNSVTQWGGGLYVGAFTQGNQPTTATMAWNVYRGNRAGNAGGGFFCDDGATCSASHEIYDNNCGGNVLVDGGSGGSGPTTTRFDHITNVGARDTDCKGPGVGLLVDTYEGVAPDSHTVSNAIFWGNADGGDFAVGCGTGCKQLKVAVTHSMVQTKYADGSVKIAFGAGNIAPADPLFVAADKGDFRLRPESPAIGKGNPKGSDLGAYSGGATGPDSASQKNAAAEKPASEKIATEKNGAAQQQAASSKRVSDEAEPAPEAEAAASDVKPAAVDASAKQAFDDAKELGTVEAWEAFLEIYPEGFHAKLARGYLKKLGADTTAAPAKPDVAPRKTATADEDAPVVATRPGAPAITRGAKYMSFPEKFNRYYTDPSWKPAQTVYVSPDGSGDGATRDTAMPVQDAVAASRPGTLIHFVRGRYQGCYDFSKETGGTYDDPVVLYAERNPDKSIGVSMTCCSSGRQTCFNFETADYIAVDGFELVGGKYGVRAVGAGYPASEHSLGIAVLNNTGHDQDRDPFFSGQSDWAVWDGNLAFGAKKGDGHGLYISNGSDWNIVRLNETYGNLSSDFQINADPASTCEAEGIPFNDPRCDAYAGEGEGGQGASDYFLVEGNYFHHGLAQGPNFTSVRRSVVRNNIFGPQTRHNVSFWQETDNPKLGSSDNKILHNLFITTAKHGVKFEGHSTRNTFANNVLLGVTVDEGTVKANPSALLMEVDDTVGENEYRSNLYVSGKLEGREPGGGETVREDLQPSWFEKFPIAAANDGPNGFKPTGDAPFLSMGKLFPDAPSDRNGTARSGLVDLGPIEVP